MPRGGPDGAGVPQHGAAAVRAKCKHRGLGRWLDGSLVEDLYGEQRLGGFECVVRVSVQRLWVRLRVAVRSATDCVRVHDRHWHSTHVVVRPLHTTARQVFVRRLGRRDTRPS